MDPRTGNPVTDNMGNVLYENVPVYFNDSGLRQGCADS